MSQPWFPQRNDADEPIAVLKNFIKFLNYPVSRSTIEKDLLGSEDFPSVNLGTFMKLFEKWGIQHKAFKLEIDRLKDIASPSLLYLTTEKDARIGEFVIYHSVTGDKVKYLHVKKGWRTKELSDFQKLFRGIALSAQGINDGETDFVEKEDTYDGIRLNNPLLINNIKTVQDFFTDSECEHLIQAAQSRFKRSEFLYGDKRIVTDSRTSYSAELQEFDNDEIFSAIRKRASEAINIPESHFESFQCVSYEKDQYIEPHFDTFNPKSEGGRKIIEEEGGQRKLTLLGYLNDDFVGGETYFPELDYMVIPKKGSLLIFNNLDDNGNVLRSSWHAGLPVTEGRKYAVNIWVRTKPLK